MMPAAVFIRKQVALSVALGMIATLPPFFLFFAIAKPVPVWGIGNFVFGFMPEGLMIGVMSSLMPSLGARKALQRGVVSPLARVSSRRIRPVVRVPLVGAMGSGIGVGLAAGSLSVMGLSEIDWSAALATQLLFGGLLAVVITPIALRAALSL